jgi:hypothetical protein
MAERSVANRIGNREQQVESLDPPAARMNALELQISQLRSEVCGEFSAVRGEMRKLHDVAMGTARELHQTAMAAMQQLHDTAMVQMRVLHEKVLSRIALLQDGRQGTLRSRR